MAVLVRGVFAQIVFLLVFNVRGFGKGVTVGRPERNTVSRGSKSIVYVLGVPT
jgi:hypothetical protein